MRSNCIKKTMIFLAVLTIGCVVVFAQPAAPADPNSPACQSKCMHAHRHGHWRMRELSEKLNLTDAQKAAIKPIFAADANAIKAVWQDSSLSKEQKTAKAKEIRQNGMSQINAILTPEQQKEFATLKEQAHQKMRERAKHRFEMLGEKLNLTDAQKAVIKPIFATEVNAVKVVWQDNSLSKEQKQEKVMEIRTGARQQVNALLTPEQQAKWAELKKQSRGMHHKRMCPGNEQGKQPEQEAKPTDSNT